MFPSPQIIVSRKRIVTSAWTPALLGANLIAYWDAGVGKTLSGANVLTWTDQSSNAYVLGLNTLAGSIAPVSPTFSATSYGGLPGITFAGTNGVDGQYLSTTVSAVAFGTNTSSWFMSGTLASTADAYSTAIAFDNNNTAAGAADAVAAISRDAGNQAMKWFHGSDAPTAFSITYATPMRVGTVFDNVNGTQYLNNVAQTPATSSFTLAANGRISVGSSNDIGTTSRNYGGIIHRIVVTKHAASGADRSNIDTWLQQ